MTEQSILVLLLGISFLVTTMLVTAIGYWLFGSQRIIRRRIQDLVSPAQTHAGDFSEGAFTVHVDQPRRPVIAPLNNWQESRLRTKLVRSGLRSGQAVTVTLTLKLLLAIALPVLIMGPLFALGVLAGQTQFAVIWLVTLAMLGFLAPDIYLDSRARERRLELETVFPDTLDLLVVCIEAGLSLDAAIQRVGKEIRHASEAMSDELQLVSLEMRAGKPRNDALRALVERTKLADLSSMISILIQAENFGTSIGDALTEHAEEMRRLRIQRAKEKAAKLPVKLAFPIIFFIFPALFLVVLGPALVRIFAGFGTAFGG